ncbi:nickel pincer cofactor biosynthesis protein LarC [Desulfovibrio inopinatus]|uniref:nickel pincer cofactor biosynthesis protein LarC n=1 Tax=Desulfovibrio inopinatus TaxID=102109 RepID=UPI00040EF5BB|nr:nickel pincer cofactor biosynthesis protein LarC [Desulfovibrio inopinatus]
MNILYYDCFAGISGDMNLAAMIDLGVDPDFLRSELSKLGLDHEFELNVSRDSRHGIYGTRVDVILKNQGEASTHKDKHHHSNRPLRNLIDIESIVERSALPQEVKTRSLTMFHKVAKAEAHIYETSIHEVYFHEVGATDSLVDMVGAAICHHHLHIDEVWSSPVELGGGFRRSGHRLVPIPAPATVEILHGLPTTRGAVKQETTTPTGAAILATLVDHFVEKPTMVVDKTAYGIGHRKSEIPNLLRVHLARTSTTRSDNAVQDTRLLQCNIDDMTAEMLGVAMDILMEKGAMDVHFTPILMKKNRPATCVSLLCHATDEERFIALLFQHTTTLGVKSFELKKTILDVAFERQETPLGTVSIKHAVQHGKAIRSKPELEDCRKIAVDHNIPLAEVYAMINSIRNNSK